MASAGAIGRAASTARRRAHNAHAQCTQVPYRYVDDLASVWSEWAEMELRHNNFK